MTDRQAAASGAMGNDITSPSELADWEDADERGGIPLGDDGEAVLVPVPRRSDHWLDPSTPLRHHDDGIPKLPDASFAELNRFTSLPPLEALRAYVGRARSLADRARWESGVVARNVQAGHVTFAHEVADQARSNERAARFFGSLADTALATWSAEREGRTPSLGAEQLLARMRRDIDDATAALQRAVAFLQDPPPAA